MKKVIICFLTLLFAVWFGVIMHNDSGYILISYGSWTLETSLCFAALVLVMLFLTYYIILRLNDKIKYITTRISLWVRDGNKRRARKQTILGLYDFAEGNWVDSEKKLTRAAKYSDMPLINYLAAAFTAQHQYAFERRDDYLHLAQKAAKDQPIAVGLVQARLRIGNKQWEEAFATLQHLHQLQPKNALILQLLKKVCLELKDWNNLKKLLPLLRKRRVFGSDEINQLELKVYNEWLKASVKDSTAESKWNELPQYLQKQPILLAIYIEYLLNNSKAEEAENILKMFLRKALNEHLLEFYALIPSTNPVKKLARAETWLEKNPENAALLLCLGRICKQQKLWGKARHYLEKSANLDPTPTIYFELGKIFEEQNNIKEALNSYSKGLQINTAKKPDFCSF